MAKLLVKTAGLPEQVIQLKLGVNRIGRSPDNDFQIPHSTISSLHCEIILAEGAVTIRDNHSTNGTFINDQPVQEATLAAGQTVRLGDVELFVESTDVSIAIPKFQNTDLPAPPVVKKDGSLECPRHENARVTHQCTKCREVMCDACVHRLRRRGGKLLMLCPVCSGHVELIGGPQKKKKKSFFGLLGKTVKLTFTRGGDSEASGKR